MNAHTNAHTRRHLLSESQQGSSPGSSGRITCGQSPLNAFGFSNKRRVNLYPGPRCGDWGRSRPTVQWPQWRLARPAPWQPAINGIRFSSDSTKRWCSFSSPDPPFNETSLSRGRLHWALTSGFLHPRIRLKKKKRVKVIVSVWLLKRDRFKKEKHNKTSTLALYTYRAEYERFV